MNNNIAFTTGDYVVCISSNSSVCSGLVYYVEDIMPNDIVMKVIPVNTVSLSYPYGYIQMHLVPIISGKKRFVKCNISYKEGDHVIPSFYFGNGYKCIYNEIISDVSRNKPLKVKKQSYDQGTTYVEVVNSDGRVFKLPPHFFVKVPVPNEVTKSAIEESRQLVNNKKEEVIVQSTNDYTFIPETEVISITIDGVKGFLFKK